jgi:phosphate/sulfate permease
MDLSNPASLISSIVIGIIGMGLFIYGKKQTSIPSLLTGIVLCVFPYFVSSVLLMWAITAACLGGLYYFARQA